MSTNQQELLHSQNNAEGPHKQNSSKLISRNPIPNTPFWIVEQPDEGGFFIIMGQWKITHNYRTEKDCLQALEDDKWNIILRIAGCICEDINKTKINY